MWVIERSTGRFRLIGGNEHRNADGMSAVIFERAKGEVVAIGVEGCYVYDSARHWEDYLKWGKPDPGTFVRLD